jgi:hypothetical protein
MAFTDSHIFQAFIQDMLSLNTTTKINLTSDTLKNALYGNTGTPDRNVARSLTLYNSGQWVTGNEISSAGQWAAGGVALTSPVVNVATANTICFNAANTVSGSTATLTAVYGDMIYSTTATTAVNQGVCYNYFGGSNSVTSGTFTVAYAALPAGIFNVTV